MRNGTAINFSVAAQQINGWTIVRLPKDISAQLPSRGQNMAEATINDIPLLVSLEPDGHWSHWFRLTPEIEAKINTKSSTPLSILLSIVQQWPDPEIPKDLLAAMQQSTKAYDLWTNITPMARWEWIRWLRSTANPQTRARRIKVAIDKLSAGKRRPCCWNRNLCTEPSISKNGVLLGS